jgi:ribosomal protein S18 acetylase RimI-like enzyme
MFSIVKATEKEAVLILNIGKKSFIEAHKLSAPLEVLNTYLTKNFNLNLIKKELSEVQNIYHIIYHNKQAAGYSKIILNKDHDNIDLNNLTKLERIYLLKEYYGLKLGYELFKFNLELSKESRQKGMWLFVWIENTRAYNFYLKTVFKVIGMHDFKISPSYSNPNHQMFIKY